MKCKKAIRYILKSKTSFAFEKHLGNCTNCANKLLFIREMEKMEYKLPPEIEVPYGFSDKLAYKLNSNNVGNNVVCLSRFEKLSLTASVAMIGIVIGLIIGFNANRCPMNSYAERDAELKQFMDTHYLSNNSSFIISKFQR